jgi:hypothetical protein
MTTTFKTLSLAAAMILAVSATAQADHFHGGFGGYGGGYGGYGGYSQPIFHGPSVHLDPVYHATSSHWTPSQGWHTHGHIDYVPHYVPGHFDTLHNGHIHANPWVSLSRQTAD